MRNLLDSRDSLEVQGRRRVQAGQTSNLPHGEVAAVYLMDSPGFQTARL